MGFGYLFFGFLMMIELSVRTSVAYPIGIDLFPDLAGYLLMLTAACRLSGYAKGFDRFRIALYPLLAVGCVKFVVGTLSAFGLFEGTLAAVMTVCGYLSVLLQPVAFFFLFAGIMSLAFSVELPHIASQARFLAVIGTAYYIAQLLLNIVAGYTSLLTPVWASNLNFIFSIVFLIYVILAEVCLYRSYMYICYEGEETVTKEDAVNPLAHILDKLKKGK